MMDFFRILVRVNINVMNHMICTRRWEHWQHLEYLDYVNCKCRKRIIDKLVEKCNENIDEN